MTPGFDHRPITMSAQILAQRDEIIDSRAARRQQIAQLGRRQLKATKSASHRTTRSLRDLVKESHVRVVEEPNVRDVVAQHRDSRRAHAERPARVLARRRDQRR